MERICCLVFDHNRIKRLFNYGEYEIEEIEDRIEVYYIPMNKEIEEALLFGLDVYGTEAEWNEWWDSEGEDSGAPIIIAGISKGNAIIEYGPTEAIYQGRDEAKADASEYDRMSIEIGNNIESFKPLQPLKKLQ